MVINIRLIFAESHAEYAEKNICKNRLKIDDLEDVIIH